MSPTTIPVKPTIVGVVPPPLGVVPNFVDPHSLALVTRNIGISCLVFTTLTTAIRLATKFYIVKAHGWADYTMFIAMIGFIALVAVGLEILKYGMGRHEWDVPITDIVSIAQLSYVWNILCQPIIGITKLSICLQFLSIFVLHHGKNFWYLQTFIWIHVLYFTATLLTTIFQCMPIAKIWSPEIPGTCLNYYATIITTSVFNVVSDTCMLVFPSICVWNLQMSIKQKVGVLAVFSIGSVALAASILRLVMVVLTYGSSDQTFVLMQIALCVTGEIAAGIIVGNVVVFPRFFVTCRSKATKLLSRDGRRGTSETLSDAKQVETPASDGAYVELKDQRYVVNGQSPYDGLGPSFTTNTVAHSDHEDRQLGKGAEGDKQIWRTVHVSQSAQHV